MKKIKYAEILQIHREVYYLQHHTSYVFIEEVEKPC